MTIWLLALILTAIACAALYYAAGGRTVNAGATTADATTAHFRAQLREIDVDAAAGRLGENEAVAARAELAREVMRAVEGSPSAPRSGSNGPVLASVAFVALLSLGTYAYLGKPDLPAQPLADRAPASAGLDLDAAAKAVEARLAQNPSDLRGWQVVVPVYMQLGRYADAVAALRHVNELAPPTADTETDLGEALMMQNGGSIVGEPLELFRKAAALDPGHIRSRFYIASEETRSGDSVAAVRDWNALLALGKGDEPWVVTARNGLAAAEAALNPAGANSLPGPSQIEAMVDGLEARLKAQGGSIDEWTRLVRSRMVQGRMTDAQADYDLARKAYPDKSARTELDVLAGDNGLVER
jgi:cytochrome c-type biogenesis protein CcmH